MTGYTKLFGSIIASTIWREKNETRILWVTMLAMANKNGIVEASIPGLADMARITIEDCEEALRVLSSPDPYSRTKDMDGIRIETVDGGWAVVNHSKYRAKMSEDDRRDYLKIKQREYRNNINNVNTVSTNVNKRQQMSTLSTQAEAEAVKTLAISSPKVTQPTATALIQEAKKSPAYKGLDVEREWYKMVEWCKRTGKKPSARRYTNWLNRAELPIFGTNGTHTTKPQEKRALTDSEASYEALNKLFKSEKWENQKDEVLKLFNKLDSIALASLPFNERNIIKGWLK